MSNGMRHNDWQAGYPDVWDQGDLWSYTNPAGADIWNILDPQPEDNTPFTHLDSDHRPTPSAPTAQRPSGHPARQSRAQLPFQLPLGFGFQINDTVAPPSSTSFLNPAPPPSQFSNLLEHPRIQQQANSAQAPRRPVATHQDNWLDRTATGEREQDRFGYFPDQLFAFDGLVPSHEPTYPGELQSATGLSDPLVALDHAYTAQLGSEMPVNDRNRPHTNIVDLTGGPASLPDPLPPRPQDSRKRTIEALASSAPASKRGRTSAGGVEEVDLTDEGVSVGEKLRQAQQQEAIRSQQAAEEGRGPKRLGRRTCIICMENITNATTTPCGHMYCHECLTQALIAGEKNSERNTGTCPVCRESTSRKKVIPISYMKKETYDRIHGRNI